MPALKVVFRWSRPYHYGSQQNETSGGGNGRKHLSVFEPTTTSTGQRALTEVLPDRRKGVVDYIEVRGRTKIMNLQPDKLHLQPPSRWSPIPRSRGYFRHGSGSKLVRSGQLMTIPAFRDPAARLEVWTDSASTTWCPTRPTGRGG